jgi:hypothetical protein
MQAAKRFAVCAALLLTSACSGGEPTAQPTVTVTASLSDGLVSTPPPISLPVQPPSDTLRSVPPRPTAAPAVLTSVVPNVVGVNHQLAQDTMQAAGFYYLTEEDATGKDRLLIIDRDWVVVSQTPAGGTHAPLDTLILLRSKKIGES